MAEQETTVPMDDKELFQSAMADEPKQETAEAPAAEAPAPEHKADETGRLHGPDGKFVSKQEKQADAAPIQQPPVEQAAPPDKDEQTGQVPSWRLREVREEREKAEKRATEEAQRVYALQQELQTMRAELTQLRQPKQDPVNIFEDPDKAIAQRLSPFEANLQTLQSHMILRASRAEAIAEHGKAAVAEMEAAVGKAMQSNHPDMPSLSAQMRSSDDPVGVAMQWHKRAKVMETTGGDVDAFVQKKLDEAMNNPEFQAKVLEKARSAAGQPRPSVQLPPSLSKAPGSAPQAETDDADMSDKALFRHAMSSPRR